MNKIPSKDICVQICNSDDKLTQREWSDFCRKFYNTCSEFGTIHFSGGSQSNAPWQNYCICVNTVNAELLLRKLTSLRIEYKQDSIAWLEGITSFY